MESEQKFAGANASELQKQLVAMMEQLQETQNDGTTTEHLNKLAEQISVAKKKLSMVNADNDNETRDHCTSTHLTLEVFLG